MTLLQKDLQKNFEQLSLDEGVLAWRGRLIFKTYNPLKPDKYGIKGYIVSESKSGYVWRYDVYCGVGRKLDEIVSTLLEPAAGQGHTVYMDNFYNSVTMTKKLQSMGFDTVGTLRSNRGAPKSMDDVKLARGDLLFAYTKEDPGLLVSYWKDKRVVKTISSKNSEVMTASGKTDRDGNSINKPETVLEYNKYMGGVDKSDQMLKYFPWVRGTMKWTLKFVFYLMQIAMFNASVLHKK